tara:strand:+ start:4103 stop:4252 length:150 start_codon:yes stop_codon:yes gene_type:complete
MERLECGRHHLKVAVGAIDRYDGAVTARFVEDDRPSQIKIETVTGGVLL